MPFCVMAHGPDRGLVAECLQRFAAATKVDAADATATVILDGATLASDPGRLADELNGPGLFGGTRLVRLREIGNDKRAVEAIKAALDDPPPDAHLAIEAGEPRRGAALLNAFERTRVGYALPCYADDERAVARVVDDAFKDAKVELEPDAREALLASLGGDRLLTRAEINKLLLYAHGADRVTLEDVRALTGDAGAIAADAAVDAALSGDVSALETAFRRVLAARLAPFLVLRDLAAQLQVLERAQGEGGGPKAVAGRLERMGGRIHFRRLPALRAAAQRVAPPRTGALVNATTDAILRSRQRPALEAEIVRALLFDVAR